jgi:hypothetical protein
VQELLGQTDRIEIHVDRVEEAAQILRNLAWVSGVAIEEGALIIAAPVSRSSEINKMLGEHGFYPSIIRPRQESLERYFLELTGAAA